MTPSDEDLWRNRFIAINLVRIGGTIVCLLGLYLWHSDALRLGGHPVVGFPMALIGLAISFGMPIYLSRRWRTPPGQ
ncbi:MAG TPA: hypothetical protein VEC14_01655 [Reyranellaceae bacterium]|nr:hypothetical protein [Reyranellaceae bacterium]